MKIGIITLHRLPNYGSALQAYALQKYIENLTGEDVEIIDYIYPNKGYPVKMSFYKQCRAIARITLDYLVRNGFVLKRRYREFYKNYYKTGMSFHNDLEILNDPPRYDLYITGSDQVWNVNTLKNNPIMYCAFAPNNARIISFGASFAVNKIPQKYINSIHERLSKYSYIGVRENSSLKILETLNLNKNIKKLCTCDPTLLLEKEDLKKISNSSNVKVNNDYILVYKLSYAYEPNPAINNVANMVAKYLGCTIIHIGHHKFQYTCNYKYLTGLGPCEFVYLFDHAKFVITSSFHGTMFSLIYRKPFISILPKENEPDCRIEDVLKTCGLQKQGVRSDDREPKINYDNPFNKDVENKLQAYINSSKNFLKEAIYCK